MIYTYIYTHINTHTHTHTHTHTRTHAHTDLHISVCACVRVCVWVFMCVYVCIYYKSEVFTPRFSYGGAVDVCGGFWGDLLDFHVGVVVFLRVCCVLLGIFLLDCFWVTASVKLLLVMIVSFVCTTLTLFMCFE